MNKIVLSEWADVRTWTDATGLCIPPSYLEQVNNRVYPIDAFSIGQMASKAWLLHHLHRVGPKDKGVTIGLFGCWVGALVPFLHNDFDIERVYGFDLDKYSIDLAERFNQKHVENSWKFKGVVADVSMMQTCDMEFETGGELIQCKPDWVINTSCGHMDNSWFETADSKQLIIMQSNNSPEFEGHINTCEDLEDFKTKYPLRKNLFAGELQTPAYTRFMQIGYK